MMEIQMFEPGDKVLVTKETLSPYGLVGVIVSVWNKNRGSWLVEFDANELIACLSDRHFDSDDNAAAKFVATEGKQWTLHWDHLQLVEPDNQMDCSEPDKTPVSFHPSG
jgi:hypothetical protein